MIFVSVPAIETTVGINLVQSQAILHFLGRAAGMDCDCEDLHTCEVIALGAGTCSLDFMLQEVSSLNLNAPDDRECWIFFKHMHRLSC